MNRDGRAAKPHDPARIVQDRNPPIDTMAVTSKDGHSALAFAVVYRREDSPTARASGVMRPILERGLQLSPERLPETPEARQAPGFMQNFASREAEPHASG